MHVSAERIDALMPGFTGVAMNNDPSEMLELNISDLYEPKIMDAMVQGRKATGDGPEPSDPEEKVAHD
jgi:hypothetical protein